MNAIGYQFTSKLKHKKHREKSEGTKKLEEAKSPETLRADNGANVESVKAAFKEEGGFDNACKLACNASPDVFAAALPTLLKAAAVLKAAANTPKDLTNLREILVPVARRLLRYEIPAGFKTLLKLFKNNEDHFSQIVRRCLLTTLNLAAVPHPSTKDFLASAYKISPEGWTIAVAQAVNAAAGVKPYGDASQVVLNGLSGLACALETGDSKDKNAAAMADIMKTELQKVTPPMVKVDPPELDLVTAEHVKQNPQLIAFIKGDELKRLISDPPTEPAWACVEVLGNIGAFIATRKASLEGAKSYQFCNLSREWLREARKNGTPPQLVKAMTDVISQEACDLLKEGFIIDKNGVRDEFWVVRSTGTAFHDVMKLVALAGKKVGNDVLSNIATAYVSRFLSERTEEQDFSEVRKNLRAELRAEVRAELKEELRKNLLEEQKNATEKFTKEEFRKELNNRLKQGLQEEGFKEKLKTKLEETFKQWLAKRPDEEVPVYQWKAEGSDPSALAREELQVLTEFRKVLGQAEGLEEVDKKFCAMIYAASLTWPGPTKADQFADDLRMFEKVTGLVEGEQSTLDYGTFWWYREQATQPKYEAILHSEGGLKLIADMRNAAKFENGQFAGFGILDKARLGASMVSLGLGRELANSIFG